MIPEWLSEEQWQSDVYNLQQHMALMPRVLQRGDRWFELKLEPLLYQVAQWNGDHKTGNLDGLLIVLQDITTQKQAEETLQHQVQELQRLSQLKDDFLSTVSHELRSPMTNIQMAVKMLGISSSPERSAHYLTILQNECTCEIKLINDLLDLQRLEAGAQQLCPEEINLNDWLPPIIHPFYERAAAQQQTLHLELDPQLPHLVSDQSSLERVLAELVNNACKYTPAGETITVSAKVVEKSIENTELRTQTLDHSQFLILNSQFPSSLLISVSNSGSEIPAVELPRIFEKFYRIPQTNPWKQGGTGLGLALVKKLVEYLGGRIQVNSGSGQTTFTLWLPLN